MTRTSHRVAHFFRRRAEALNKAASPISPLAKLALRSLALNSHNLSSILTQEFDSLMSWSACLVAFLASVLPSACGFRL